MSKCNICGREIQGWGNNPWPLCEERDVVSKCCDECNQEYVLPARILALRHSQPDRVEVGDEVCIFYLAGEPNWQDYILKRGIVESVDNNPYRTAWGTWGKAPLSPYAIGDNFVVIT